MQTLEAGLFDLARLFLIPALVLIVLALAYAFVALGGFLVEAAQRRAGRHRSALAAHHARTGAATDDLELWIMKRLEWLRVTARSAPLIGLVATMIPMGPALLALGEGDGASIGKNLVVAFSGVVLALIAASIAHFVLTVRRRWLLEDLRAIERGAA
ncbi:MotA/TolQ/ExbB proton channel family protein [Caulobacter endophyticus]|uniref:MotA/TolQ/ExbB proton channel family protein n=1 Tax=Caulobacter endophyticus TaxID=2172652 RepID=UPI0024108F90|nr:MotA/TolQ/ExbB proton channel family protein [Caulobacter endophyticus]MDG2528971.1 MotA/TolQ/ExbB proton channel family protein [Caulobacter endophyticus]